MRASSWIPAAWLATGLALPAVWLQAEPAGGFSPEEAVKRMQVAPGLEVQLVAAEPEVRQPITLSFDERGRMWVLEYLQFPNPAGLKPVKVDEYMRTVYDRVPEPPPRGPRGADDIVILTQPDANGRMRRVTRFVTGLNLASGMALGYDGVFVIQPPYLLYYADRDHDDAPDGPPEVLLSGFGIEDSHALANSLQFGPDGWLYGAQGSTVKSLVNGIAFEQGIWRYNVRTKAFELFAEGGGNTWGLDFDAHGNAIAGTNYQQVALHHVQGAYYVKLFAKHGELHNPYAFGYFDHIPVDYFHGGHLTIGGIIYQGGALPDRFNGAYIAGNPLTHRLFWHSFHRAGSSFTLKYEGEFLVGNDTWFRPVDCQTGPEGAVYILDWYDRRIVDVDPRDNWDKTNGRIYKVQAAGAKALPAPDLSLRSSGELAALLGDRNDWLVRMARQILAERRDPSAYPILRDGILDYSGSRPLQSLWALFGSGGFDDDLALKALDHANEDVRAWTVRLLGDAGNVSPALARRLAQLAQMERSSVVRNQIACTAKRLPGPVALPVIRALLRHDEDLDDPQIPMLLWWALESKATSDREETLRLLESSADWSAPIVRRYIVERLARRYAAEPTDANFDACRRLLTQAPSAPDQDLVIQGMEKAFEGRAASTPPSSLQSTLAELWRRPNPTPALIRFSARFQNREAQDRARTLIADITIPESERIATIKLLAQLTSPENRDALLGLLEQAPGPNVYIATLAALQAYPDQQIAQRVLAVYSTLNTVLRRHARTLLEARGAWALLLLEAVDSNRIAAKEIPVTEVQKISRLPGVEIASLVGKHWGRVSGQTQGQDRALARAFELILTDGQRLGPQFAGDAARGRKIFANSCATCHSLFGEGGHIGPDLTAANRHDRSFMIEAILYPSLTIRPEFVAVNAVLKDGRTLSGFVVDSNADAVTIRDVSDQRALISRSQVISLEPSPVSLMPPGLLEGMQPQEVRDLFAYLESDEKK